jgi:TetR/AcrR family transcriptional regulator
VNPKRAAPLAEKARPEVSGLRTKQPAPAVLEADPKSGATKTPRRLKQIIAKKTNILDAAIQLFSRYGLHGTSVEQIAEHAQISKTNLFYYFASKEEVYTATLQRLLDGWLEPLKAIEIDEDPAASIRGYIRQKLEFSRGQPEASRLFCLEIVQGAPLFGGALRGSLKDLVAAKAAVIEGWIDAGKIAPVDPFHLIFSIWAITQHYADFAVQVQALAGHDLRNPGFFERTVENIQRIILDGIQIRDAGGAPDHGAP